MVQEGLRSAERGELIDDEEVGKMVYSWEAEERAKVLKSGARG